MSDPSQGRRRFGAPRLIAYLAATLFVALAVAAFLLPEFLDSPAIRSQIQRKLSEAVGGEVRWEKLDLSILPSPRGVLHRARAEIPGIADVRAERIEAGLLFWPLLRGNAEITDISVARPEIRLDTALLSPAGGPVKAADAKDPFAIYRSILRPIVDVVRKFAPDTSLMVRDGTLDVRAAGVAPIQLRDVSIRVRTGSKGMEIEAATAGNIGDRIRLSANVDYSDLSGSANLEARAARLQPWLDPYLSRFPVSAALPAVNLKVRAHTDGMNSLECEFDTNADLVDLLRAGERVRFDGIGAKGKLVAGPQEAALELDTLKLGPNELRGGKLRYEAKSGTVTGAAAFDLDLRQGVDFTRRLVRGRVGAALARLGPVSGQASGRVELAAGGSGWRVGVDVLKSNASVQWQGFPGAVQIAGGSIEASDRAVKVENAALSMPAGRVSITALNYSFRDGAVAGDAVFDLDLAQTLADVRGAWPGKNGEAFSVIQSVGGRAQGKAKFAFSRKSWNAGVEFQSPDAAVGLRELPAPVRIAAGAVEIDPRAVTINRAALAMLDAHAVVSAAVSDYRTERLQATASLAEGVIGEQFLAWVWQRAKLPPRLEPKAPVHVVAQRIKWSPKRLVDVSAIARFDAGPEVAIELGWTPGALDIRRAAIKDGRSDAVMTLRARGRVLEGGFSGALYSASLAALFRNARVPSGAASGDLRFVYDRDNPRRTTIEGTLKGESLDLAWLTGRPVKIVRIDLATDATTLRIHEAVVDWAGQRATVRGQMSRSANGPVIDAQLESPGIDLDAWFPPDKLPAADRAAPKPGTGGGESWPWPLPFTGRIAVRADSVQRGRYKVAPLAASLVLEERRAHLDLTQAQLCGISLPLTIEATPAGYAISARILAQQQPLQQTAQCLTDSRVSMTGLFDLKAELRTQGKHGELARNLKGTVNGELRDGKVMKFALLGNILSMQNVAALLEKGGPRLDEAGFPYRTITVSGHFEGERFLIEESAFRSDAVGIVANGWVSAADYQSSLSVLVAPFSRVDEIVRKVPILGYVIGGTLTSVPVGVHGDIRDPIVVPLGPGAVTSELKGIFERTLKLPGKLIAPLESRSSPGDP